MIEIGRTTRTLPAPPSVVWRSLMDPHEPGARPWLALLPDEVEPRVLQAQEPHTVVWSSLWPDRPDDEIHLELSAAESGTALTVTLLTADARLAAGEGVERDPADADLVRHLRRRLSVLFFADLRYSYGQ